MMRISSTRLAALAMAAALGVTPEAKAQPPGQGGEPALGKAVAEQLCSACHVVSEDQQGPVPDGVPTFAAIAARPGMDRDLLAAILIKPTHPAMPEPPLTQRQMDDVVAYILSLRPQ